MKRVEARQVNSSNRATGASMLRQVFAASARDAAAAWRFTVPTSGPEPAKAGWVVEVPVRYSLVGAAAARGKPAGQSRWHACIPGPVQEIPWALEPASKAGDAIASDTLFVRDSRFVL